MKTPLLMLFLFLSLLASAQTTYPSDNIQLIGHISPNTTDAAPDNRHYSGCWGWYQANKNKEYALSGSSKGTYFIDITAPATPSVCDYVEGGHEGCIWRELKTYSHYCYIISDDGAPNKFQIVDLQYLPDSVHLVYSGNTYFERAHTIWIDNDKMYAGGVTYTAGAFPAASPMVVFSLANPESPTLLRRLEQDISNNIASYVHDMFVRNDTVYASCAFQGLQIFKFNVLNNTFTQLGSFANYNYAGYNHSSSLTKNGKYLVFCDEEPVAMPIHVVDVQNLSNIQPIQYEHPWPGTTPHNPYVLGNDFVAVACYQDGLNVYGMSSTGTIQRVGYFDTYPQGGANTGTYNNDDYAGNWGAYPYLPSGIIIAQDMQNGVFLLDATQAFHNPLGIKNNSEEDAQLAAYPNPVNDQLAVNYKSTSSCTLQLKDLLGRVVYEKYYASGVNDYVNVGNLASGSYVLSITQNNYSKNKSLLIQH